MKTKKMKTNKPYKCYWTHNIAEALECSPDGKFDDYGFAETNCSHKHECDRYQNEVKPQYKEVGR